MTDHQGLPVPGYKPQPQWKVDEVTRNKYEEEALLRRLDHIEQGLVAGVDFEPRWLRIARTHFEEGYMAMNRAFFMPERAKLPADVLAASVGSSPPEAQTPESER